jgi:uncharacterized protein (TIGR02217 family)
MAFLETPRFPDTIAFGASGGPEYSTGVVEKWSGSEQRNRNWSSPRYRYQIGLALRSEADTRALYAFFNAITKGMLHGFRFPDFNAGESTGIDELIGTGTGSSADYQLVKRYASGPYAYDRIITKLVSGSLIVKVAGVATGSYSVNTTTGIVTMSATLGAAITATYTFDVPVHFTSDRLPIIRVDGGYQWDSIELVETREIA